MVEQYARYRKEIVALAIVDRDEVTVDFSDAVGAARVEGGRLRLRGLADLAEHLGGGSLVEADLRVDEPDCLHHPRHPQPRELARQDRLVPARGHERLRGQIVDLVRRGVADRFDERILVQQVCLRQRDALLKMSDTLEALRTGAAHHSHHTIALLQQQLGQVRAVLSGDAGDQRGLHNEPAGPFFPLSRRIASMATAWRRSAGRSPRGSMEAASESPFSGSGWTSRNSASTPTATAARVRCGIKARWPPEEVPPAPPPGFWTLCVPSKTTG